LHPQAQAMIELVAREGVPDYATLTPTEARALAAKRKLPPGPEVQVSDLQMPGPGGPLRLRLYQPSPRGFVPGLVYYHGGGFVVGSLDSHDPLCRALCQGSGCAVVSVEYRLAPEAPFPAPVNDAYAALSWVHENADELGIDHQRLAVGGDSAGATLATVAARLAKERRGPPVALQLLAYPITDLRTLDTASYAAFADGYLLTRASMAWFRDHYLQDPAQRSDPRASPLAADNLIGLPPALVITAEYDVLRDEAERYAERLVQAGVRTELVRYPGMIHGFLSRYALFDDGRAAVDLCCDALVRALVP
jgi:acetyl esterase